MFIKIDRPFKSYYISKSYSIILHTHMFKGVYEAEFVLKLYLSNCRSTRLVKMEIYQVYFSCLQFIMQSDYRILGFSNLGTIQPSQIYRFI